VQLLLIGNDPGSAAWLIDRMNRTGFTGTHVQTHHHALNAGLLKRTDAIMVDVARLSPESSSCIRSLREAGVRQPLMIVADQANWSDKVASLDAGADDFLMKPVSTEEIASRFRAIMRRTAGASHGRIAVGRIAIDLKTNCAWLGGEALDLTRSEFRLLRLLHLQPGHVFAHREIADHLHADGASRRGNNAVEVLISRLRQKIGHGTIRTVRGSGYKYMPEHQVPAGLEQQAPVDGAGTDWCPQI
jgi:two-component system OmpR family response regulator